MKNINNENIRCFILLAKSNPNNICPPDYLACTGMARPPKTPTSCHQRRAISIAPLPRQTLCSHHGQLRRCVAVVRFCMRRLSWLILFTRHRW
jgi:hypothetical protein